MKNFAFRAAAILGLLGVAFGAFGAHALKETLLANGNLETYETAARYHLIHALLLLGLGLMAERRDSAWLRVGSIAAVAGILVFSGSLYILSITDLRWLGAITPIGGLAFMLAWLSVFMHFIPSRTHS